MRHCALLGRTTFALILATTSHGIAEAQYLNGSQYHNEARPGLSISTSIVQHTTATITESGHSSTTALQTATATGHTLHGCFTNCTFDDTYMTQNRNSWTKCLGTVMIGRVHYFVDAANNKTSTSTDYSQRVTFIQNRTEVTSDVSNILSGGSHVLTRTDVNAAGTVTYMDGTNTMAYPTGFNVLPSLYVWNGTLPYTTNGSTACATANDDTTSTLRTTNTWTMTVDSSSVTIQTHSITGEVVGATPIPSVDNLPTHSVYNLDKQDPKGWTYCYAFGHDTMPGENFYSLFSGSLFDQLRHNCSRKGATVAPLVVVDAAAFLLDETTSYIDSTKTEGSEDLRTRPTEISQTPTDVLVDPIQSASKSPNVQKSASSPAAKTKPSTTTKLAQSLLPTPISHVNSDQSVSDNEPAQTTTPASSLHEESIVITASQAPVQDAEGSNDVSQQSSTASAGVQLGNKVTVATQTIAISSGVQIDALNSLIQNIGELRSSSDKGAVASFAGPSTQASNPSPESAIAATSVLPEPIVIGTSTATVNSDGNFMIGTHALQPTDSPYVLQGTTYALDSSKSALIVNGISTHAVAPAQQASDNTQAATLTINGMPVTANSASDYVLETQTLRPGGPAITVSGTRISLAANAATVVVGSQTSALSKTMGIGDYVWAGLAGMLSAASENASSLSSTADTAASTSASLSTSPSETASLSTQDGSLLLPSSPKASDSETAVDESPASPLASKNSSSTGPSSTDLVSTQQTSTSIPNAGTTSQTGPSVPSSPSSSSSSSSSIGTQSESNSGRVIVSASFAIPVLSLVVAIFA